MADRKWAVRWSPEARADIFAIWNHYRSVANELVADRAVRTIVDRCRLLQEHPFSGRTRDELKAHLRSVAVKPHVIFYRVGDEGPQIVRVLHGRQDLNELFAPH